MLFPFLLPVSHPTLLSPSDLFSCAEYLGPTQDPLGKGGIHFTQVQLAAAWTVGTFPSHAKRDGKESVQEKVQHTAEAHGCYCGHTRLPFPHCHDQYVGPLLSNPHLLHPSKTENIPTAYILGSFGGYTG